MKRYLLDTNIVSLIAPSRRTSDREAAIAEWVVSNGDNLFLSVITATEIEDGIAKARRTGAARKAHELAKWWAVIRHHYASRFLDFDLVVAIEAGRLLDVARAKAISPGFEDIAIAATALVHGMAVVTRNVADMAPLEVEIIDPYAGLP